MGICKSVPKYRVVTAKSLFKASKKYPSTVLCKVKKRDFSGKIKEIHNMTLKLPDPISVSSHKVVMENSSYWISSCMIPGLNANSSSEHPVSQDSCKVLYYEDVLFIGIFDGFGFEGEKLAEFCAATCETYFFNEFSKIKVRNHIARPNCFLEISDFLFRFFTFIKLRN